MRILLTGAGGQIGRDLIAELHTRKPGASIVATDLRPPARTDDPAAISWRGFDVTDERATRALLAEVKPDLVFHLAAILSAKGEANPTLAYAVNQTGTWNILEACRAAGTKRF